MDYMLFMAKILMLDTNKVISVIFEIICINFHLTMIIGDPQVASDSSYYFDFY